jgi:ferritin-like metal-binding protein YciE
LPESEANLSKGIQETMPITTPKELCVSMLSELRHGAERSKKLYEELGQAAQNPQIKEALDARELVSSQITSRLDECFKLIGEKPSKINQRLHDVFIEDFRRDLNEIQGPLARRLFVLAKASHLAHLQVAGYMTLIAAADTLGHPGVGVLLESCLADKLAFMDRTKQLIREHIAEKVSHA